MSPVDGKERSLEEMARAVAGTPMVTRRQIALRAILLDNFFPKMESLSRPGKAILAQSQREEAEQAEAKKRRLFERGEWQEELQKEAEGEVIIQHAPQLQGVGFTCQLFGVITTGLNVVNTATSVWLIEEMFRVGPDRAYATAGLPFLLGNFLFSPILVVAREKAGNQLRSACRSFTEDLRLVRPPVVAEIASAPKELAGTFSEQRA